MTAAVKKAAPKKGGTTKRAAPAARKSSTSRARHPAPKKSAPAARPAAKKTAGSAKKPTRASKPAPPRTKAAKKAAPAKKSAPASKATARPTKKSAPASKPTATKKQSPAAKAVSERSAAPRAPRKPSLGPYAKDDKFLEEQAALLRAERAVYEGQAHDLRAEADSLALEREPGDVQFDEESGEGGTVTVDRERNLALSAQAGAAVEEIDDALRKIERKTYGTCERCHQPIPKARLRALPYARLCVACKSGGLSRR